MMGMQSRLDRFTEKCKVPGVVMPGNSLVEIIGNSRVLVDYHKGIVSYCEENIVIRVCHGRISVFGTDLKIACMTEDQLVIYGNIGSVSLDREGR